MDLRPPRTIQDIIDSIPSEGTKWNLLREVLLHGNLTAVDPTTPSSYSTSNFFGTSTLDTPHIIMESLMQPPLSHGQAAELILADIIKPPQGDAVYNIHPHISGDDKSQIAAKIMLNVSKPLKASETGQSLWNIRCPSLDTKYVDPKLVSEHLPTERCLRETTVTANVMPYGGIADLHHDVGYGLSTLVVGKKLWVWYPPTEENFDALSKIYESRGGYRERIFDHFRNLSNGVAFIQTQNMTVWVPPFCAHAVFTLQTSILTGREIYAKSKFPQRLASARVHLSWSRASSHGQKERKNEVSEVLDHLGQVLQTDDRVLHAETVKAWTIGHGTLKTMNGGLKNSLKDFMKVWSRYTADWTTCPFCEVPCGDDGVKRAFMRHFQEVHCK
ncbi:hypothetical protein P280DRAFT_529019 [Massarina eburnea CBS 473.64]|uniref:JmjC domain-containing protein n=1 Tax=Massarina eburnea CBS 473.64 TaxID=1395130 RepID=A0A6A6RS52_9PLEO|nr:hypothetical protein P280DRAFT_529019 [Massarina eburnea CBS 473.64]